MEDTEYFDIVAGVLKGDTLAPYLVIICLDNVLRASIDKIRENDADYADDIAILANTHNQAYYYIVWNELPQAVASMSMHTKQNICAIIK